MICTCRDPLSLGAVHRADAPCYIPEQRTWVGLTLDERSDCYEESDGNLSRFAKAIEAKLKDKNGY